MTQRDNYWTIPNALSGLRICIAGYLTWAAFSWSFGEVRSWLNFATLMALVAFAFDYIDGKVARVWPSQASRFGAMIDPIADKLSVAAFLLYLYAADVLLFGLNAETVMVALIVFREGAVSCLRWYVGHERVPVVRGGKWKTTFQMAALIAYGLLPDLSKWTSEFMGWMDYRVHPSSFEYWFWSVALSLLAVATYMTVTSGVRYFRPFLVSIRM